MKAMENQHYFIVFLLCFEGFHLFHCGLQHGPRTLRAQLQAQAGWGTADKKTMEDDRNRESWEYMGTSPINNL
jgi:hypothetical protein